MIELPDLDAAMRLAVAAAAGLAVGIEREWSGQSTGPRARFAGARTFLLFGLIGGTAGLLATGGFGATATVLIAAGAALTLVAYVMTNRFPEGGGGATTEAAALAVIGLGVLAGLGQLGLAGGSAAVVVLALGEKERIRGFVRRIGERELQAALQFAVLALVVLPLLPSESYGPLGGVQPQTLWLVVLLVSGMNFAGYLAQRGVGQTMGLAMAGLLGGLVSSTVVSISYARRSRNEGNGEGLAFGVIGACAVLIPRVLLLTAILSTAVAVGLVRYLLPPLVLAAVLVAIVVRRAKRDGDSAESVDRPRSPLRLWSAIKLAIVFQAALFLIAFVRQEFGSRGVLTSAALVGLTSLDAVALSMTSLAGSGNAVDLAALAIAVGVLANTLFKLALVIGVGRGRFRPIAAGGLAAFAVASGLGLWLF